MIELENMLDVLALAGVTLAPDVQVEQVAEILREETAGAVTSPAPPEPYADLLFVLSNEIYELTPKLWMCDTECIYDDSAYSKIATQVSFATAGDLPIEAVDSTLSESVATLSFSLDGKEIEWTFRVMDDWLDPKIFERFSLLLAERGSERAFAQMDNGQAFLMACLTKKEMNILNSLPGVRFSWM